MNTKKQTLVILTPGFAACENDSTCLPMQQHFIKYINKQYPDIQIIILSFHYPFHANEYKLFGNTVIPLNGRNRGTWRRLLRQRKAVSVLKSIHDNYEVIGLLSFWYSECAAVANIFAKKQNLKHFCWLLGQDARKNNKYPRRVKLGGHQLLALSDFIQDEFERNHRIRPFVVLPPVLPKTSIVPIPKGLDLLAAGSLIPLKQYEIFMEVAAFIKQEVPSVKALLIGDGIERIKLEKQIDRLNLKDTVFLSGKLLHADVLQAMQRAKIFLHPSSYEGFGVVCLEALSVGAKVISFTKPMNKQIKNWYTVKTKEEMAQVAIWLLKSGHTSYENVIVYKTEDIVKQMMELFTQE